MSAVPKSGSSGVGGRQLTGHGWTHGASAQQAWVMAWGMAGARQSRKATGGSPRYREARPSILRAFHTRRAAGFISPESSASLRTSPKRSDRKRREAGLSQYSSLITS